MSQTWINTNAAQSTLARFFSENKSQITEFGNTVNQTFEAFVFASVVNYYKEKGWNIEFKHPSSRSRRVRLKFSTRGRPDNYTYAVCSKGKKRIQIRHSLRVATKYYKPGQAHRANIVIDVAVISNQDLSHLKTDDHVENRTLITFGEAKHMSAFAELIAGFIGMVHELVPDALTSKRAKGRRNNRRQHLAPFLYVSGHLWWTAQGLVETIEDRGCDIDIFDEESGRFFGISLPKYSRKTPRLFSSHQSSQEEGQP